MAAADRPQRSAYGMKPRLVILALVLGAMSCTGTDVMDEQNPEGADSMSTAKQVPDRRTLGPEDLDAFEADAFSGSPYWAEFTVDRKYLEDALSTWHRVPADQWANGYSHVGGGDRSGTISLRDGRRIRWMVRPGGLATLSFPDGAVYYLAKELTSIGADAEPADASDDASRRR